MGRSTADWRAVDAFLERKFARLDRSLARALSDSSRASLPPIHVSALQGRFLEVLARSVRARRILEIGTLGGFSTLWLARALPLGGRLVSLELEPRHAAVARRSIRRAGLSKRVEVREGPALETLATMVREGAAPFDLVFIDADKPTYPRYLRWSLRLLRDGGVIVADNVVRGGKILSRTSPDPKVVGARRFLALLARTRGVRAVVLQTVGTKGYDGLALAYVERGSRGRSRL